MDEPFSVEFTFVFSCMLQHSGIPHSAGFTMNIKYIRMFAHSNTFLSLAWTKQYNIHEMLSDAVISTLIQVQGERHLSVCQSARLC